MDKATKKQITRRTAKDKLDLIEKWEKSGLTITSFCHQHGFSDSLFYFRLKVYRQNYLKLYIIWVDVIFYSQVLMMRHNASK